MSTDLSTPSVPSDAPEPSLADMMAAAVPEESPPEAPSSDPSTPEPADPSGADPPSPAPDDDTQSIRDMEIETGLDLSRYSTFKEAIRGLGEVARAYGRKNEDAQFTKSLRDKLGEDKLAALLTDETEDPPAANAGDQITINQIREWQAEGKAGILSDANRTKLERFSRQAEKDQAEISSFGGLKGLEDMIDRKVAALGEQQAKELAAQRTQQQQHMQQQAWLDENGKDLFIDPSRGHEGGLTDLGRQARSLIDTDPQLQNMTNPLDQTILAVKLARGSQPTQQAPLKPSRAAQREPAVSATLKTMTQEERGKKWAEENPDMPAAAYFAFESQFPLSDTTEE